MLFNHIYPLNIAKLMLENECNEADAADMDNMESNPEDDIHNVD
jgi:hypothetical protein